MANKKQVALVLAIIIVPAFIFMLFQGALKNYYNLPKLSQTDSQEPFQVKTSIVPQNNTFWIVGLDKEKNAISDSLYNLFTRIIQKEELKKFLNTKLPNFGIKYLIIGKPILKNTNILFQDNLQEASNYLLNNTAEVVLVDNEGFIRGKYNLLNKQNYLNNDEIERLITEIKVLIEITANPKKK